MKYTPKELFVGAIESAPNCTSDTSEQEIWPKLMLMVFLEGRQDFEIDGRAFSFDAGHGEARRPAVHMLNIGRTSRLRFMDDSEVPLRKVMISAPQPWLAALIETGEGGPSPVLRSFLAEHLAHFSFEPASNILQIAHKILTPPPMLEGELSALYLKAQGLDIMWQCCLTMAAAKSADRPAPSIASLRHGERVRDFILANLDQNLTIEQIAAEARSSASTVQRNFKRHFGMTISEFVQFSRLDAARTALITQGVQVSHAAHLAGYSNLSSFTTAFRKRFGVSPSQVRA